ncbi:KOW domain-containing RNA-binding protein [Bacillus luteolus]|uniref:KOW domain-containing RNA-binding protein n=1 Tax=Litchfieldia luteola TaxID=682179 RepID=A0ABR9QEC1_9BACI|nr:KOW domain-containing RNA-binding protein [Cytobacillus luteolus]MBE4906584.1 KOW domain-containing RNA-binding protein [Cytobacillus luteolus]MBP1944498.1 ribosomal protein L14E/L6E/L27E [Cytobacillus luteolus]
MRESDSSPLIGQFVMITEGRDAGQYAVIIQILDERFVLLADGDKRKFNKPKKKNINHLEFFNCVSPEVQSSINETSRVTNGKLKYALQKFINDHVTDLKKGEQFDG